MERKRYPADLTDAQWAQLVPLLIKQSGRTGRPRKHELRSVVDALLYVLRGGISWRALPHDFPPWESGRLSSRYALALCLVFAPMIAYAGIKLAYLPERAPWIAELFRRRDQRAFFTDLLDVPAPSLGMMQSFVDEAAAALHPAYQEIRSAVRASAAAGADETGWSLRGSTRWIWTAVSERAALFRLGRSRSAQEYTRLLGRRYGGLLTSDRWSAYKRHPLDQRQLCWAHLRRNFEGLCLRGGAAAHTGDWGVKECDRLFHAWHCYVRGELSRTELRMQIRPIWARFRRLLRCGAESENRRTAAMCRNLLGLWPALWRFLSDEALDAQVEPTNNAAERALRRAVLWRKTSFGSQSGKGLRATERLLSVTETARQNGADLLAYLTQAITAHQQNKLAPRLLPAS